MVVETRQHRAFISIDGNTKMVNPVKSTKAEKKVVNKGTNKSKYQEELQAEADKLVAAKLENLPALKRAGRYSEAISYLNKRLNDREG